MPVFLFSWCVNDMECMMEWTLKICEETGDLWLLCHLLLVLKHPLVLCHDCLHHHLPAMRTRSFPLLKEEVTMPYTGRFCTWRSTSINTCPDFSSFFLMEWIVSSLTALWILIPLVLLSKTSTFSNRDITLLFCLSWDYTPACVLPFTDVIKTWGQELVLKIEYSWSTFLIV